jgi:hypothetical protein
MATAQVRSIALATEVSFGSVSATTGLTDVSGLTFRQMEVEDRGALVTFGDMPMTPREAIARDNFYVDPPEPATILASGIRQRRRKGELTVAVPLRPMGTTGSYATMALGLALSSSMARQSPAVDGSDVVAGVSASRFTPTALGDYTAGQLVKTDRLGRPEYAQVVNKPADIYISPAFSGVLGGADTVRQCETWYTGPSVTLGSSLAIRIDGDTWRTYATGCRLKSIKVTPNDAKLAIAELTFTCAFVDDDHSNYSVSRPDKTDGQPGHALGSYTVVSSTTAQPGSAAPYTLARTALAIDTFSFSIDFTLVERGQTDSIVGASNLDVVDAAGACEVTLSSPVSTYNDDILTPTPRSIFVGLSSTGAGNGVCLALPAGIAVDDSSKRDLSNGAVRQVLKWKAGLWTGVNAATALAESPVLIGMSN